MADEDFDVDSLAAYMHMSPQQISRLADRGKLPGRKVGGKWRFSRAQMHHWLEERIGLSGKEELIKMEGVFQRDAPTGEEAHVVISDLLHAESIAVPLPAKTRASVIAKMTELAAATGLLWDVEQMADAVRAREEMYPTALDNGVALMHPRRPMPGVLGDSLLALGITPQGIPFGGGSGKLTDVFFLICSESDGLHLRILARLSRLIGAPDFLTLLRQAPDARAVQEIISEFEGRLD